LFFFVIFIFEQDVKAITGPKETSCKKREIFYFWVYSSRIGS